jgi:hypothetical protein
MFDEQIIMTCSVVYMKTFCKINQEIKFFQSSEALQYFSQDEIQ